MLLAGLEQLKLSADLPIIENIRTGSRQGGYIQQFKIKSNYRKSDDKIQCCKTCENCTCNLNEYKYTKYYKCLILGTTHSLNTDIRLSCVCDFYKNQEDEY